MKTSASGGARRYGALAAAVTVGMASIALPIAPAQAAEGAVDDATFSWAVNEESGGGAYFGGANWLVAGAVGDVHGERGRGSTVWDAQDEKHFTAEDGNTTITRPDADGNQVPASWAERNQDANGDRLSPNKGSSSWNQANISSGTGTVDPETDSAQIQWEGSFTMVYYGGMTYWTINDPKLVVEDGEGTITGTMSGYGADMNDLSKWVELDDRPNATVADLTDVNVTDAGIEVTPEYAGVEIDVAENGPSGSQNREKDGWGSFPQDWIDFNVATGQAAYWYTSGGLVDAKKTAAPITIGYSAETPAPAEFAGETTHVVTAASEEDGLGVTVAGTDYANLPPAATGKDAVGVYSAVIDRDESNEFTADDVLGAQLSFFRDTSVPNSFEKVSEVDTDELDEAQDYDAVVWAAHGNGTEDTVLYREPIELTEEQKDALFPEKPTAEPTDEPTDEPTAEPTEEPTGEPTAEPTEEPTGEPTDHPTESPTEGPTGDPSEEPSEDPSDDPSDGPTGDPSGDPSEDPSGEPGNDEDGDDQGDDQQDGVRLLLSADTVGISDFLNADTGVTLSVDGLEPGDTVEFAVDPTSGQDVDPALLTAQADEDGVASTVVYGTNTAAQADYIGDYAVTVDAEGATAANAGQDEPVVGDEGGSAQELSATFSVVADEDAPGGGPDDGGSGDDGSGGGDSGSGDKGSDSGSGDDGSGDGGASLPRTGATIGGLFAGLGAIAVGAGALFASRRRDS